MLISLSWATGSKNVHLQCNGHYNRTPDLGRCAKWWNTWDLARYSILDMKVLDRNVTWLTKHKDTLCCEHMVRRHLTPLVVMDTNKASLTNG